MILQRYDNVQPGLADRAFSMAEEEGRARRAREERESQANIRAVQLFAWVR